MGSWFSTSIESVKEQLGVSSETGLSSAEVSERLNKYGINSLQSSKKLNPLALFFNQFKDVLVIILIISATVSLGLSFVATEKTLTGEEKTEFIARECKDKPNADPNYELPGYCLPGGPDPVVKEKESPREAMLIYAIIVAIAVIGFLNEYKAEKTVEALKKLVGSNARVRRDGKIVEVSADQLVPGDIVLLSEGQKVPADMRLYDVKSLSINEASLTGESLPVTKTADLLSGELSLGDQKDMAFAGTFVTAGTGEGVVVETGQRTELGKIADMVDNVETEETPMQKKLDDLGKKLGFIITIICALVFIIVFFFVREALDKSMLQRMIFAFTAAVALAVAAIPEGLAFVVRISLALGARRMAAKKALVRHLTAVEALGSTDVICSDKTGTLTRGEMTVRTIYSGGVEYAVSGTGYQFEGEIKGGDVKSKPLELLLRVGTLCNNSHIQNGSVLGDPTEGSLLVSAAKTKMMYEDVRREYERVDEIPFTSERKVMSTVNKNPSGGYLVAYKGAVELVLDVCDNLMDKDGKVRKLTNSDRDHIIKQNEQFAGRALRMLAFAYKEVKDQPKDQKAIESGMTFVGIQAMMDPPREEVIEVIHRVHAESGMRVIMITGDYIETAKAVAREIGIEGDAVSGVELDQMSQEEFERRVEDISVYARVNPEHKIRIVQALKKHGHQVAMTGDGVNDAPAIKAADIGIAMGITGTDASKEAADLVLLDDQFLTIIGAIEEGRGIFDNVRKFVNFLISCNIAEVLAVLFGILFFNNLILTAAQILFINIVTDGLPAVALGSDPAQRNVLKAKPIHFQEPILTKRVWAEIFTFGALMTAAITFQYWYNQTHEGSVAAVSAAFTSMVVYELVRLIDIRTDYKIRWFSNPWLSVAILSSFVLQFAVLYVPFAADYFSVGPLSGHDWLFMGLGSISLFVIMKLLNPVFDFIGPENRQNQKLDKNAKA